MKRIGGRLLPALAVIPALVVTGASLIALISGEAGNMTASAPSVALSASEGPGSAPVPTQPAPTQAPQERAGVEGQMPSVAAVQVQPERLSHQTIRPASLIHNTALVPVVMRQPTAAQPQPSGNASGDRSGSNSGSGSSNSGEDRGHSGHGDDDPDDDDHGHDDHEHDDDD